MPMSRRCDLAVGFPLIINQLQVSSDYADEQALHLCELPTVQR